MAAPITHILLAKEFLRRYPAAGRASDFVVGASFPDIRYLGVITRGETHLPDVSLKGILNAPDAFEAGMQHHALVDVVREKFFQDRDVYASASKSRYITQALKLFEDELLYGRLNDWGDAAGYFKEVLDQEMRFPIAKADITRWHGLLREYVQDAPSADTRRKFILSIGFTIEVAEEIEQIVDSLRKNESVSAIIKAAYQDFTSLMNS